MKLASPHERNVRDASLLPEKGEFGFTDGCTVSVPADADEVLVTAGKDFCDYLDVSMGVSARFSRGGDGLVRVFLGGASCTCIPGGSFR